jgi:hypothetical protein
MVKSFTKHIKPPKQGWTAYKKPIVEEPKPVKEAPKYVVIDAPLEPVRGRAP